MSSHTQHGAAECRAPKHTRVQHLITADEHSLTDLEFLLATLPLCSTGRVFVEVPDEDSIVPLTVPPRMVLTWLDRSRRSGEPGSGRGCGSGQALSRAVIAWANEMLCEHTTETKIILLGDSSGRPTSSTTSPMLSASTVRSCTRRSSSALSADPLVVSERPRSAGRRSSRRPSPP